MFSPKVCGDTLVTSRLRKRHRADDKSMGFSNHMESDMVYEVEAGPEPILSQRKASVEALDTCLFGGEAVGCIEEHPTRNDEGPVAVDLSVDKTPLLSLDNAEEGNFALPHGMSSDSSEGESIIQERVSSDADVTPDTPVMPFPDAEPTPTTHPIDRCAFDHPPAVLRPRLPPRPPRQAHLLRGVAAPRTRGAITTLFSIAQLAELVESTPLSPPRYTKVNGSALVPPPPSPHLDGGDAASLTPSLRLREGESVLILLHNGAKNLSECVSAQTVQLSHIRIFTLDLTKLPPREYAAAAASNTSRRPSHDPAETDGAKEKEGAEDDEDEEEEEEELFSPARLSAPAPGQRTPPADDARLPLSAGPLLSGAALSDQLLRADEHLAGRLGGLLRVDAVRDPAHGPEPFLLPAMVLWRAGRGDPAEYAPPCADPARAGPVVVKPLHALAAVHALALYTPVYTTPHLFRTVAAGARGAAAASRTLLYFGASWCPPCMRVVGAMPEIITEDLPASVRVLAKADMDLATPIFEFFDVQTIPTFVVLDNRVILEHDDRIRVSGADEVMESAQFEAIAKEALSNAEIGRIQNSQRPIVKIFLEKHCNGLSFDEDF